MSRKSGGGEEVKTWHGFLLVHLYLVLQVEVPVVSYFLGRPRATSAARAAVEAVTDWNGTSVPLGASGGSSLPAREFAPPTWTWQTQGAHTDRGKKTHHKNGKRWLLEGKERGKAQATPFGVWVRNALWHHPPTPPLQKVLWGSSGASGTRPLPSRLLFYGDNEQVLIRTIRSLM